jgi:plasmid stabilization system protein ParE
MPRRRFHLTAGAIRDYRKAGYESARDFGTAQSQKYRKQLRKGFQHIADEHHRLRTPHREALAEGTEFKIHLVQHHYVVYIIHDTWNVIIVAVLPESMDIPNRLIALRAMSAREIEVLRREIARTTLH